MSEEDYKCGIRRQARIDTENWDMKQSIPIHQKVGTVIPFSRTVDRDPNPRIPLSVAVEHPSWIEVFVWIVITNAVWMLFWWVA